jgi:hypothetical protein
MTGVSHPTVAKRRAKLEATGDVEKVSTRTDTQGRQQPSTKSSTRSRNRSAKQPDTSAGRAEPAAQLHISVVGNGVDPEDSARRRMAEAEEAEQAEARQTGRVVDPAVKAAVDRAVARSAEQKRKQAEQVAAEDARRKQAEQAAPQSSPAQAPTLVPEEEPANVSRSADPRVDKRSYIINVLREEKRMASDISAKMDGLFDYAPLADMAQEALEELAAATAKLKKLADEEQQQPVESAPQPAAEPSRDGDTNAQSQTDQSKKHLH